MIAERENSAPAKQLFAEAITRYDIAPGTITVHNDRGAPMTATGFIDLLADLPIDRGLSRPRVSNDNPYSESCFKTIKYQPDYPGRFRDVAHARLWFAEFFAWYADQHRHSGLALFTPADVFFGRVEGIANTRQRAMDVAFEAHPERFVKGRPQVQRPPSVGRLYRDAEAAAVFTELRETVAWQHDELVIAGKRLVTARQVAWYGDREEAYHYSGFTKVALPWTPLLTAVKERVETAAGSTFNACLRNLYASGDEGMSWHSDDEGALGRLPTVASLSFGARRRFDLRHKRDRQNVSVLLHDGQLTVMTGATQHHWEHALPNTKKVHTPRINLTFRTILDVPTPRSQRVAITLASASGGNSRPALSYASQRWLPLSLVVSFASWLLGGSRSRCSGGWVGAPSGRQRSRLGRRRPTCRPRWPTGGASTWPLSAVTWWC